MDKDDSAKALSQQRFGEHAAQYVTSERHAKGSELDRLIELAQPQPDWCALDVATGGGHTALKFAPHVGTLIATDLTPRMLESARAFIQPQAPQVRYAVADAEQLPFARASFDLVTCRIAPHHFPDAWRFVQESARVLKPGGVFVLQDSVPPDDDLAARYLDSFERLRDPSHHRAFAAYEWRGMFADADLIVEHSELISAPARLLEWAQTQGNSDAIIERLQVLLYQAPSAVADWIRPRAIGTADAMFDHVYIIMVGRKQAER